MERNFEWGGWGINRSMVPSALQGGGRGGWGRAKRVKEGKRIAKE